MPLPPQKFVFATFYLSEIKQYTAAFLKLWSSGSALAVLLDRTLVQKGQKK
jgi:hypothetical protein